MFPKFPFSARRNHRLADHDSPPRGKARARVAFRAGLEALEGRELLATALLPDLVPWVNKKMDFLYGWGIDKTTIPGHTLLTLNATTANIGPGPLEMIHDASRPNNPDGTEAVDQVIYNSDGTSSLVPLSDGFIFDPNVGHEHIHYEWLNTYNLRKVNADGSVDQTDP